MLSLDLEEKLERFRKSGIKQNPAINSYLDILKNHQSLDERLSHGDHSITNDFNMDVLESERIYHIDEIKKLCIVYRLWFLETALFKNKIPDSTIQKIKDLENEHHTSLTGFKIIAPSKLFKLENADDPMLFAPIGNEYYYLIDKWGNDMTAFRKWLVMPFRSLENLLFTTVLVSILCTILIPVGLFSKSHSSIENVLVFLFMFKSVVAVVLYYGFAMGKNFNTAIWNSKYSNA